MSKKSDIRMCKFGLCSHGKEINTKQDEFIKEGRKFFHPDCWELYQQEQKKINREKADVQLIRHLCAENIGKIDNWGSFYSYINMIRRSYSTDYIIFGINYCISHKIPIKKYTWLGSILQRPDIREEYRAEHQAKNGNEYVNDLLSYTFVEAVNPFTRKG